MIRRTQGLILTPYQLHIMGGLCDDDEPLEVLGQDSRGGVLVTSTYMEPEALRVIPPYPSNHIVYGS